MHTAHLVCGEPCLGETLALQPKSQYCGFQFPTCSNCGLAQNDLLFHKAGESQDLV